MLDEKAVAVTTESPMFPGQHISVSTISKEYDLNIPRSFEEIMANSLISKYENERVNYVPIPNQGSYYDIDEDETKELEQEMILHEDQHIFKAIERLQEYPFLLLDKEHHIRYNLVDREEYEGMDEEGYYTDTDKFNRVDSYTYDELWSEHPDIAKEIIGNRTRYEFITLSGINRRQVKDSLYPYIADLAEQLSGLIREEFEPDELYPNLSPRTVGIYEKNKGGEAIVHITEFMDLNEMKSIILMSDHIINECGFESKNECKNKLGSVNELRKRVMHANRTLVSDRDDLSDLDKRLGYIVEILESIRDEELRSEDGYPSSLSNRLSLQFSEYFIEAKMLSEMIPNSEFDMEIDDLSELGDLDEEQLEEMFNEDDDDELVFDEDDDGENTVDEDDDGENTVDEDDMGTTHR
ncbi:hypothetical protein [Natrarchaeobaculum sulfurireducens]|uniref:Uncharacterized protein n=1 Tax=Natrarchaeobaculum sulfurireducens TaxID=2044521 RepID=A0A346PQC1_9EURY|nr:hypothetical protein [Natrarchaeobaculum sulfurireducens]AXR81716.1 hypothetical protein AArcMg_1706 [Natrarchaeobaculum sulfurireducens]